MVKAIVDIDEHANRIINIVKARYGLRDKSESINTMARLFEENSMDPDLRPEYAEKLRKIEKEPTIKVKDFSKEFDLE